MCGWGIPCGRFTDLIVERQQHQQMGRNWTISAWWKSNLIARTNINTQIRRIAIGYHILHPRTDHNQPLLHTPIEIRITAFHFVKKNIIFWTQWINLSNMELLTHTPPPPSSSPCSGKLHVAPACTSDTTELAQVTWESEWIHTSLMCADVAPIKKITRKHKASSRDFKERDNGNQNDLRIVS